MQGAFHWTVNSRTFYGQEVKPRLVIHLQVSDLAYVHISLAEVKHHSEFSSLELPNKQTGILHNVAVYALCIVRCIYHKESYSKGMSYQSETGCIKPHRAVRAPMLLCTQLNVVLLARFTQPVLAFSP